MMEGCMRMVMFDPNHHIHRAPKLTQDGTVQYRRQFSNKGRRWVAVTVKEPKDYNYLQPLMAGTHCESNVDDMSSFERK